MYSNLFSPLLSVSIKIFFAVNFYYMICLAIYCDSFISIFY